MRKFAVRGSLIVVLVALLAMAGAPLAASPAVAHTPVIAITADQAFDAVTMGIDPATGSEASVALVDLRDPMEIFWSGAPAAVNEIQLLDETSIEPDWGKVRLIHEGKFAEYHVGGHYRRTQVAKIGSMASSQIAVNIPLLLWPGPQFNGEFGASIAALAESNDTLILFCRTGGRAWMATGWFDATLFDGVYVIDGPGANQVGGFSGIGYDDGYNGYVGFPGRQTDVQEHPSVSWMDAGLPMVTMVPPQGP